MSTIFEQIAEQVKEANNMYEAGADQEYIKGLEIGFAKGASKALPEGFKMALRMVKNNPLNLAALLEMSDEEITRILS